MIITFEGPDSAGKSTQANILYEKLKKKGLKVKLFHFPRYESPIGEFIGKVLQNDDMEVDFTALQMLYVADQLDFSVEAKKLLEDGYILILDRYDLSTIAYYIAKTKCDINKSIRIVKSWQKFILKPDITFIFDAKHRISDRRKLETLDKIEKDKSIMDHINNIYQSLRYIDDREIYSIDASLSIENIADQIEKNLRGGILCTKPIIQLLNGNLESNII